MPGFPEPSESETPMLNPSSGYDSDIGYPHDQYPIDPPPAPDPIGPPIDSPIQDPVAVPISTLVKKSNRYNASSNFITVVNHRYKGARESSKFNLMMQKVITILSGMFVNLRAKYNLLEIKEQLIVPTDAELSAYYHCELQIRFREWLLMKSENKRWFN